MASEFDGFVQNGLWQVLNFEDFVWETFNEYYYWLD